MIKNHPSLLKKKGFIKEKYERREEEWQLGFRLCLINLLSMNKMLVLHPISVKGKSS